jgi:hypothetical protein
MLARICVAAFAALPLMSCTSVVQVRDSDDKKLRGIPFYVKNEYFRQVSVYRETWYRLTLKAEKKLVDFKDGKEVLLDRGTQSFTREVLNVDDPAIIAIKTSILNSDNANIDRAKGVINDFQALTPRGKNTNESLLSNSVGSEWVVESGTTYFLNAPLPWFGAGNLTQKLNPDGTLSEVTSNPDTKLSEGIAAWLPLKEFLTGKFVKAAAVAANDDDEKSDVAKALPYFALQGGSNRLPDKQYVYILSLDIEETGFETSVSSDLSEKRLKIASALPLAAGNLAITRKPLESEPKKKSDDSPTIGISGSIKLPKEKSGS